MTSVKLQLFITLKVERNDKNLIDEEEVQTGTNLKTYTDVLGRWGDTYRNVVKRMKTYQKIITLYI